LQIPAFRVCTALEQKGAPICIDAVRWELNLAKRDLWAEKCNKTRP